MKRAVILLLSSPFLIIGITFDLVKIPVVVIISPIWFTLWLIELLKGEEKWKDLTRELLSVLFMGFCMWLELVNLPIPEWMDP
jgi:hypothetical protein